MEITKETVVALIGTSEGFSAEAVKEQLEKRREAVEKQLLKFRSFHEIKAGAQE